MSGLSSEDDANEHEVEGGSNVDLATLPPDDRRKELRCVGPHHTLTFYLCASNHQKADLPLACYCR